MKERKSTDEQFYSIPNADDYSETDLALDQQRFNEWLSSAKSSDDVRNRIAVSGGTVSRGVFGKFYLLVPNGPTVVASNKCDQGTEGQAANDMVFDQPLTSNLSQ